jgi:Zn-dependent protease with chaperone function
MNCFLSYFYSMQINELDTRESLDRFFQKSLTRSRVFFIVSMLWFICCAYLYVTTDVEGFKSLLKVFFGIAIGLWLLVAMFQLYVIENTSIELSKVSDSQVGNFSITEIRAMFQEVMDNSVIRENPTVYLSSLDMCNAFAINTLFYFYKPTNAIYMTRKCFEVLTREEILAILYHEMAHFNRYMYMEGRTMNVGMYFFMLLPFSFTALIPGVFFKIIFVVVLFFFVSYLWNKIRNVHEFESHALEYLCDSMAAERVGKLAMINALITICRVNASIDTKSTKEKLKVKAVKKKPKVIVDWGHFDTHIVNGKIEAAEYHAFIQTLENLENPQLIENSEQDEDASSHPSLTKRVLFLHRNLS